MIKIKNPSLYFKNKISKLNKLSSFKKKKQEFSILLTNNVEMKRLLLLVGLLFWSCEDEVVEVPAVEDIGMWVNGDIIPVYDYYESITTFGKKIMQEDGSVKKIFVIHFQKDLGRITPEKEHYALIFYDNDADNDNDLKMEK